MATLARITVQILDENGLVEVRGGEGVSAGVLPDAPSHVRRGATVRLRVHASAVTGVAGIEETLEVQGRVTSLEGPKSASGARCREGLTFKVDVHEVRPVAEDLGLPFHAGTGAPAVSDLTELEDDELPTLHMPPQSLSGIFQSQRVKGIFDSGPAPKAEAAFEPTLLPPRSLALELDLAAEPIAHEEEPNLHSKPPQPAPAAPEPSLPAELDAGPEPPASSSSEVLSLIDDTEPSGLFGTLREMPLVELLQSLELSRKTAAVALRPKDGPGGEVFVDHGRVVYATAGDLEGEDAFFALTRARRGAFRVRFHATPPKQNIDSPTAYLVLEAHRRLDEEGRDAFVAPPVTPAPIEAPVAPPLDAFDERDDDVVNPALLEATLSDELPEDASDDEALAELEADAGRAPRAVSLAFQVPQVDDDAPTAAERPYPAPRPERTLDDEVPVPSDPLRVDAGRTPTQARLFSHFFEEASEEGDDAEDDPAANDDDIYDALTFTSLRLPHTSSEESRTGV